MIPAWLLYLGQTQLALLLLLAVYYGLLRRLTFHQLNRLYLLGALLLSVTYPVLNVRSWLPGSEAVVAPLAVALPRWTTLPVASTPMAAPTQYGYWLLGLYQAGAAIFLVRLVVQAVSLWQLHRRTRPAAANGLAYRAVAEEISPFSFGRAIYLNPAHHAPAELPLVLLHEQAHVRQGHTVDVLLAHLHRVVAWWSPAAWLWLRAVQENLEFIADATVLRKSAVPVRQYQYSLVQRSALASGPALVIPFSFITLKNRIRMMNSQPSSSRQLLRYAAVLPLSLGLLLTTAVTSATPAAAVPAHVLTDIEKPAPISALPPAALAYIVQQYPGYRLIGLSEVRAADGGNLRYKVEIAIGRRPEQLLFDDNGQALAAVAADPLYFVDGRPAAKAVVDKLDPKAIDSMNVLKGEAAVKSFGAEAANGVVLIVTKQNKNSAELRAFNKQHNIGYSPAKP